MHLQGIAYLCYGDSVSFGEQREEPGTLISHSFPIAFVFGFFHTLRLLRNQFQA
jgi:hypothetical protein